VLVALSTSGRSANIVRAVEAANDGGLTTWGLTGRAPSPLAEVCDDVLRLGSDTAATTQELHLVALHILCGAVDRELALRTPDEEADVEADGRAAETARRRQRRRAARGGRREALR
jgi:fructoselysine-6-P-deglycase FrlB-like protein